ncbi:MAG TPA: DUF2934 domain-containing protein [Stellaceae bacterium]|nr:DUF2934 domain-containing protein [Stellaceae bacterium]
MTERLVDVLGIRKNVIHTFPITIEGSEISDAQYENKALEAAAYEKLVPDSELHGLSARMHMSRSGPLEPFGDNRPVLAQTKENLDHIVRDRAYLLWEQEGCPDERADEHWQRAQEQHLHERAHALWEQEGRPEGRTDEHLDRTREFEALEPLEAPDPQHPAGSYRRSMRQHGER